jgi:integrase
MFTHQDIGSLSHARLLFEVVAVAPISANRLRSVLVKLFGWACESALLSVNPMQGVKKPHREGKGKTRTLNDQEIRVLWQALEKADAAPGILAALKCLLLLGQRPGEVAGMAVSELHRPGDYHRNRGRYARPVPGFRTVKLATDIGLIRTRGACHNGLPDRGAWWHRWDYRTG